MNAFVVVGNIQRFDITKHFERNNTVIWKQVSNGQVLMCLLSRQSKESWV